MHRVDEFGAHPRRTSELDVVGLCTFDVVAEGLVDLRSVWGLFSSERCWVIVAPFEEVCVDSGAPELQVEEVLSGQCEVWSSVGCSSFAPFRTAIARLIQCRSERCSRADLVCGVPQLDEFPVCQATGVSLAFADDDRACAKDDKGIDLGVDFRRSALAEFDSRVCAVEPCWPLHHSCDVAD